MDEMETFSFSEDKVHLLATEATFTGQAMVKRHHPETMIPIGDLRQFTEPNPELRVLKPWWDVIAEYINILMIMLSLLTASIQISYEKLLCVAVPPGLKLPSKKWDETALSEIKNNPFYNGYRTNLDLQYFSLINQWCYDHYMPTFTKFFPYIILLNSLIFLISSNFWFKFPGTSSKIEHFLTVLGKCLNSPWTAKALSATLYDDTTQSSLKYRLSTQLFGGVSSISTLDTANKPAHKESTTDYISPAKSLMFNVSSKHMLGSKGEIKLEKIPETILDKKDGEKAKALFEKVKKFRVHTEEKDILFQMYKRQAFLRAVESIIFIIYIPLFVPDMQYGTPCFDVYNLTGFHDYYCIYGMYRMYSMISTVYMILLCIYTCLCFVNFWWIFHSNLREYSFERIRRESGIDDIPDVINDFAFLLHLIDQYDSLYSGEFAIFLSDISETKLLQVTLNNYWTLNKLKQSLSVNSQGKTEMHLYMMPAIPNQVFELDEIEVLKLELSDMTIPACICRLKHLTEFWVCNCTLKVNTQAIVFLKKNLEVLKVFFSSPQELPPWINHLGRLNSLYLYGQLQSEKGAITLHSFRDLKQLQYLYLKLSVSSLPSVIMELASTVTTLIIHNEGTKLSSLAILKTFKKVQLIGLIQCRLERIPNFIFSLIDLREINLEDNNLKSLEELASLQQLIKITALKFGKNRITAIPSHIGEVSNIESLYLNNNLITVIHARVFNLQKLIILDVSYNTIQDIPHEIGQLEDLQNFSISNNSISKIPDELFTCIKLQRLKLSFNQITVLSPMVGNLTQLKVLELTGNKLNKLPVELDKCVLLSKNRLQVETEIFDTLPQYVKDQMQKAGITPKIWKKEERIIQMNDRAPGRKGKRDRQ